MAIATETLPAGSEFVPEKDLVEAVAGMLAHRLSKGELDSIRRVLPGEIRTFFTVAPSPVARDSS